MGFGAHFWCSCYTRGEGGGVNNILLPKGPPFLSGTPTVTGQMTQTKSWGSKVEFIYARGPRGGSLQILGARVRQKPVYIGRGLTISIGAKMWGGAWHEAGSGAYRSRRRKLAWWLMAWQDFLKMEFSFPVTFPPFDAKRHSRLL